MKKKTTLYLGLDPSNYKLGGDLIHLPLIKIAARPFDALEIEHQMVDLEQYTHLIFTSKNGVKHFWECLAHYGYSVDDLQEKKIFAVGEVTARSLQERGIDQVFYPQQATQEGLCRLLSKSNLQNAYFFLPQSSLARSALTYFLSVRQIRHQLCTLYDTITHLPDNPPSLEDVDEIVFTSPSTVDAFLKLYKQIPSNKEVISIGPITKEKLNGINYRSI